MRRLLSLALAAAVAVPAAAQDAPRRERVFTFGGPDGLTSMSLRRGRLGVLVDLVADAARDSIGARIVGVTPGGAAERAGVQTGDVVLRFNGTRLAVSPTDAREDEEGQSRPGMRLINLASRLDPGDTVRLELRRAARTLTLTFAAEESDMDVVMRRGVELGEMMPGMAPFMREMENGPGRMRIALGVPVADVELVKLNAGLGEYFGTAEGLLVVEVGADSSLGLRAGDVIVSIGGRRPTSPAHAMRILGTYEPREAIQIEIMRQRRRSTITGRMPERRERVRWRAQPNSFEVRPGHVIIKT